jgi:holo-[acyl-carrier protein] synthase
MAILRTGVDMVEIARLNSQRPSIRARFLERVFTAYELAEVGDSDAALAGRFAVKEAVSKALGSGIGWVRWQDIEVRRGQYGAPVLHLYGNAEKLATMLGLDTWSVSITDTETHAVAVAVAIGLMGQEPLSAVE